MPRLLPALALLLTLVAGALAPALAAAQDATPPAGQDRLFADTLGLPELAITATADAFEGVPAETAAGRYVVTLTAAPDTGFGAGVEFVLLPEGTTFADFAALFAAPPEGGMGGADATPAGEVVASPVAGGAEPGAPEWYFRTYLAGGVAAAAGASAQVILDLRPGTYVVLGGDPTAPQAPVELRVTGGAATPAAGPEPAAAATLTMFEYGFALEGELAPGPRVLKVTNVGAQPHFAFVGRPGGPVTKEQIGALLEAEMAGTPVADAAAAIGVTTPDEWTFVGYAGTISTGATEWIAVDLEPGTYVLACFVPDIASGMPHAYLGMYDVITVGDQ